MLRVFKIFSLRFVAFVVVLAINCHFPAGKIRAANDFITGFPDLPLMPDMNEVPDTNVIFVTPDGRIVVTYTRTWRNRIDIMEFYKAALSELGWVRRSDGVFFREGEVLVVDIFNDTSEQIVRFSLTPE